MKSDTKDTMLLVFFFVLMAFNMVAVGLNIGSCICSVGDIDCIEACEQKTGINHAICFVANVISLIAVSILIGIWRSKK